MARLDSRGIRIDGLADLRRALEAVHESMGDVIEVANKKAADFVAEQAQRRASGLGPRERAAAGTLKVTAAQKVATLRLSATKAVPFALGAEFGAYLNQRRVTRRGAKHHITSGWNQFRPWKGNSTDAGYFLWPTIRDRNEEIVEVHAMELERLLDRYYPVHGPALPPTG